MIYRSEELDQLLDTTIHSHLIKKYLNISDFGYFMIFHPSFQNNLTPLQLDEELNRYKIFNDDKNNLIATYQNVSVSFHILNNGKRIYFINNKPEEVIKQLTQLHHLQAFQ